jgi:hypothetical protein
MVRAEVFTFRGLKLLVELLFRDAPRNSLAKTANPRMAVRFRFRPQGAAPAPTDALIPGSSVGRASGC